MMIFNRTKTLLLLGSMLAVGSFARAQDTDRMIVALTKVESNGNAAAVGDNGKAFGILQIHISMVRDANRIASTTYTHADMFNESKAIAVAKIVLKHYSKHILTTTGRPATLKELAFIWNGGGSAWKRASNPLDDSKQRNLEAYWNKVVKALY